MAAKPKRPPTPWPVWKRRLQVAALIAVVAGSAVGLRLFQLRKYPIGDRIESVSPNGLNHAFVGRLTDKGFFGGVREYYDLEVELTLPNGPRIRVFKHALTDADVGGVVNLDNPAEVFVWSPESHVVTFHIGRYPLRVDIPL